MAGDRNVVVADDGDVARDLQAALSEDAKRADSGQVVRDEHGGRAPRLLEQLVDACGAAVLRECAGDDDGLRRQAVAPNARQESAPPVGGASASTAVDVRDPPMPERYEMIDGQPCARPIVVRHGVDRRPP